MGCFFTKAAAAALLSLSFATSLVITDPPSSSIRSPIPELDYRPDGLLRFILDVPELQDGKGRPIFTVQVESTENPCGESDIVVNGQRLLSSQWDGLKAWGKGTLTLDGSLVLVDASWKIICLSLHGPVDDISQPDRELVQVLTLQIGESQQAKPPGFTVSFHKAGIVQFDAHPVDLGSIISHTTFWRTPSEGLKVGSSLSETTDIDERFRYNANSQQQILHSPFDMIGRLIHWEIKTIKNAATGAVRHCRHNFKWMHEGLNNFTEKLHDRFCQREPYSTHHSLSEFLAKSTHTAPISIDELLGKVSQASATVAEPSDTTNTSPSPASQTRSISQPASPTSTQHVSPTEFSYGSKLHLIKTIGLIIIVAAFLTWLIKRIRDPRRRADRAARREERRNRCLYRHAARVQKWRNWIYALRHKFRPVAPMADSWDEKRARVIEQETILDVAMNDDIRALRYAHVVVSGISAAEQGRNDYIYEAEASERRRSVVTLPGYESDSVQPPGYDDNGIRVADGFRYVLAESVDTPDSSVISTSPRISRDGRDSDFGKELEWTL
ncbi:hypothetical protein MMC07_007230 [Pseudocyphellaria aurata]|nr:hypothetical protein [Pseudocyphellaria aurata]